ncbi:MAG: glycosyltransferase family 4 protein [Proteobacteria bacterium]|jgi:glycosyltransferase involved in cell wall biosynthesis|nr:glycosyltransferase family 4 protein [Pseudomonadota bacterium]
MKIEFISVRDENNGYGVSKNLFLKYFKEFGVEIVDKFDFKEKKSDISLVYSYPTNLKWCHNKKRVCFTMFETDHIPDSWIPILKQYDLVIVPTKWGAEIFKKSGIDAKVINLGFNDEIFTHLERPQREIFTFLNYEAFTIRKGWRELFTAFTEEFDESEPVKMIFKTVASSYGKNLVCLDEYKNIEVINEAISQEELMKLLGRADCFVFPSRGEGFGITPLEAMATGIPAIVPNAHGISEYFNPEFMIGVDWELIPAKYDHIREDVGNFVKCDIPDLRKKMRLAYENAKEWREKSGKISEYALKYNIRESVRKLIEALEEV